MESRMRPHRKFALSLSLSLSRKQQQQQQNLWREVCDVVLLLFEPGRAGPPQVSSRAVRRGVKITLRKKPL
jgi:hypothetical protein